jgi:hypothetical protein
MSKTLSAGQASWPLASRILTMKGAAGIALGLLAMFFSFHLCSQLGAGLFQAYAEDVWFQADLKRVVENMTDANSSHFRNKVHPIASLVVYPLTQLLQLFVPGTAVQVTAAVAALSAGIWVVTLYCLLLTLGLSVAAACAFCLLALSSAGFVMFFSVPELYHFGSLSLMLVLLVAARAATRGVHEGSVMAASAASLSITVTNWMAGLLLAFACLPWRRAVRISAVALAVIFVLALVQKLMFPTSGLFFVGSPGEGLYMNRPDAGTVWNKLAAMLLHAFVMPETRTLPSPKEFLWPLLSVQFSPPGSGGPYGRPALLFWVLLLGAGIAGAFRLAARWRPFVLVLAGTLLGQVVLHLIYGEETFLYSLHFTPLLITLAALSWFTPAQRYVIPVVLLAAVLMLANNLHAFASARAHVESSMTQREKLAQAMQTHPGRAWPRNAGHIVLGAPGAPVAEKGYHEPGGSFSPAPNSFGISIHVTDPEGRLLSTSDTLPMAQLAQSLVAGDGAAIPSVRTETGFYTASWTRKENGFSLKLLPGPELGRSRLWLVVRSVGPSGGPVRSLRHVPGGVAVNDSWSVLASSASERVVLGDESAGAISLDKAGEGQSELVTAASGEGWLYAALPVATGGMTARIERQAPQSASAGLPVSSAYWTPQVPDKRFAAMAYAQQAHLLMGLTDMGTRPGEPVSYDSEWIRDGAYVLAALARAGQSQTVEKLAVTIAEKDFMGGFGAEADAPGLGIWALAEASRSVARPAFDTWAWPHVRRKAGLILQCLDAARPVIAEPSGPVLQSYRNDPLIMRPCESAMNGLAIGAMDHHYPVLFVNAVNYLGLREAAAFARRTNQPGEAERLDARAGALAAAWQAKFTSSRRDALTGLLHNAPGLARDFLSQRVGLKRRLQDWVGAEANERTYVSGLWPSGVIGSDPALRSAYLDGLETRWQTLRTSDNGFVDRPKWTYFAFAEAHQWLLAGNPGRAWATLHWFMESSSSPGLYTWWEEGSEENVSHRWTSIRGWTNAGSVTPHYWSAAEALLLQMSMLTYVDNSAGERALVIGAGVPAAWLRDRIDSGTLATEYGPVRWVWDGAAVTVDMTGKGAPIRLAPVFGDAAVVVNRGGPAPASLGVKGGSTAMLR